MMKKVFVSFLLTTVLQTLIFAEVTTSGQKGLVRAYSAKTLQQGKLAVNFGGEYSRDLNYVPVVWVGNLSDSATGSSGEPVMITGNFGLSFGLTNFWDLSLSAPMYADFLNDKNSSGQGDIIISTKVQYPPYQHTHVFDMAYLVSFIVPTGARNKGLFLRQPYHIPSGGTNNDRISMYTTGEPEIDLKMLWTLDIGEISGPSKQHRQIQFHTNFGIRFTSNADVDHVFLLNQAVEYSPVPFLTVFTEFVGETRVSKFTKSFYIGDDALWLTPGFTINTPPGLIIKLAFDLGLSNKDSLTTFTQKESTHHYKTRILPAWSVNGALEWAGFLISKDKDKDGIKDKNDRCPDEPEDVDGYHDNDGCPDLDNDKDGIPDVKDKCPSQPEDIDGFEDSDGCPEGDNDKDGIPDDKDKCPAVKEDVDGFEDHDGCPDLDNDKDGVPDSLDKCKMQPEDMDGFEDDDGCPDLDNDKDGIPDKKDKCPMKPENINEFQDDDGCPDVKKKKAPEIQKRMILKGVEFKTGSAELTFESYAILNGIVDQLKDYPEVRIEIRGYTDNIGKRSKNMRLSQKRAQSVKQYLINKGVAGSRLVAIGFGPDNPIASNRNAAGRRQNRRIEFYRLN